jgi:hypothetical protein
MFVLPCKERRLETTQCFTPPPEVAGQFGDYRSPLKFLEGREVTAAAAWPSRPRELLGIWHGLMGAWPQIVEHPKLEILTEGRRENLHHRRVRLEIASGQTGDGWLLGPEGRGPFPAVVVVLYEPETRVGLKSGPSVCNFGIQLARRGYVALSIGS